MEAEPLKAIRPFPILGTLSILVPILGVLVILLLVCESKPSIAITNQIIYLIGIIPLVGFLSLGGAWLRHERHVAVRWIGLMLNLPFLLAVLILLAFAYGDWHM